MKKPSAPTSNQEFRKIFWVIYIGILVAVAYVKCSPGIDRYYDRAAVYLSPEPNPFNR